VTPAYFDTSVLVKNYVEEAGSARARRLLRKYIFLSSSIAPVELMSALVRRKSRRELDPVEMQRIVARVRDDRDSWKLIDVGVSVLPRAEELVQNTQLRALDAIHIACLVSFQDSSGSQIPFVTGDSRQHNAAEGLGFNVIWVG
jgi:predicted nucleic acid-binding protein